MSTDLDREEALRSKLEMAVAQAERGEFSERSGREITAAGIADDTRRGAIVGDALDFMDEHDGAFRDLSNR